MVECGICSEDYKEGDLELHREMCVVRLMFRCSLCDGDYVSKEGLWNHLDLHEIADESKELHHQEIKAKHKLHQCVLCNDQRAYSESPYWKHIHDIHDGFFLRCSDCGENFRSESLQNDHALSQCMARKQTEDGQVPIEVENMTSDAGHSKLKQKKKSSNENKVLSMRLRVRPSQKSSGELILNDRSDPTVAAKNSSSEASCTKCSHCGIEESSADNLAQHILVHHEPVACDLCGNTLSSFSQAQHHMKTMHKESKLKCPHCSMQYTWRVPFERHVPNCKKDKFPCEGCGNMFKNKIAVHRHKSDRCRAYKWCKEQEQKNAETSLPLVKSALSKTKCYYCNEDFSSPGHLIRHLQIRHELTKCEICGITILGISAIKNHKIKFHTEPKYECPTCGRKFHRKSKCDAHSLLCEQGMYQCKLCGRMFKQFCTIKRHYKRFHPDESSLEELQIVQDQKQVQSNDLKMEITAEKTTICDTSSTVDVSNSRRNEQSLATLDDDDLMRSQVINKEEPRMVSEKTSQPLVKNPSNQPYSCNACGITLSNYRQMKYHVVTKHTEGKFQCPHCSRKFHVKRIFENHTACCVGLKHSCELCGQKFNLICRLENHKKQFHHGDRPLRNANIENQKQHTLDTAHEMTICMICRIAFISADELKKHKLTCPKQAKEAQTDSTIAPQGENIDLEMDIKVEETMLQEQEYEFPNQDAGRASTTTLQSHDGKSKDVEAEDAEDFANEIKVKEEYIEDEDEILTENQKTSDSSESHEVSSDRNDSFGRHEADQCVPCSICGLTFGSNPKMRYHMRVCHAKPRYKCSICQKPFHYANLQRRHEKSCSEMRCSKCGIKFMTRRQLNIHYMDKHPQHD